MNNTSPPISFDRPGQTLTLTRHFTQAEFDAFARLSGDDNPIHVDPSFAARTRFGRPVAHGMFLFGVVTSLLETWFPGAVQVDQSLVFPAPTFAGEAMTLELTCLGWKNDGREVVVKAEMRRPDGELTLESTTRLRLLEES